ncbi:MAG: transposase, partial [Bdellovibrionales bacterium]|nr:transposase [Bdellovibrionales bacterium]
MAKKARDLTDEQWDKISKYFPEPKRAIGAGRKPIGNRDCFEGILWVLRSGARWQDLPKNYPSPSTCWRRLRDWEE